MGTACGTNWSQGMGRGARRGAPGEGTGGERRGRRACGAVPEAVPVRHRGVDLRHPHTRCAPSPARLDACGPRVNQNAIPTPAPMMNAFASGSSSPVKAMLYRASAVMNRLSSE